MSEQHKKTLGFWMLTALVVGNMVGSGVFLLPASLAKFGTISIVGWGLTALGAILLALVFCRLSRFMPRTGGHYVYCHEAFGDFIGFQVAYNYWMAVWIGNAAIVVAFIGYLSVFWPALAYTPWLSLTVSIVLVWTLTIVNIIGLRAAGIVQVVTTILKLLPLFLLVCVGLWFVKVEHLQVFNISGHSHLSALTSIAAITLWSFIGFESATIPADNVINPRRNIPLATIIGTLLATVIYLLGTTAVMGILPMKLLAHSSSPFADAARTIFGNYGADIVAMAAVIACLGTLNGWILLQGQMPMAAARDGLFPKIFSKTTPQETPYIGLIVSSFLITGLLIMRYGASLVDEFTFIILLAVLASLIPYLFTTIAEIILYLQNPERLEGKSLLRSIVLSGLAFAYAFWAIAGAGMDVVYYGMLLFLSGVPLYACMYSKKQGGQLQNASKPNSG